MDWTLYQRPCIYIVNFNKYFRQIYHYFGFNGEQSAWYFFRKFLVDGYLSFEIIYSPDQKEIIGFKEIDPVTLMPGYNKDDGKKVWVQFKDDPTKTPMGLGMGIVPGIGIKVGPIKVVAKYCASFALNVFDKIHSAIFDAMNLQNKKLKSESEIADIFIANGIKGLFPALV